MLKYAALVQRVAKIFAGVALVVAVLSGCTPSNLAAERQAAATLSSAVSAGGARDCEVTRRSEERWQVVCAGRSPHTVWSAYTGETVETTSWVRAASAGGRFRRSAGWWRQDCRGEAPDWQLRCDVPRWRPVA